MLRKSKRPFSLKGFPLSVVSLALLNQSTRKMKVPQHGRVNQIHPICELQSQELSPQEMSGSKDHIKKEEKAFRSPSWFTPLEWTANLFTAQVKHIDFFLWSHDLVQSHKWKGMWGVHTTKVGHTLCDTTFQIHSLIFRNVSVVVVVWAGRWSNSQ